MPKRESDPLVDRDDHQLKLILIVVTLFVGFTTGKIILDTALMWLGPK